MLISKSGIVGAARSFGAEAPGNALPQRCVRLSAPFGFAVAASLALGGCAAQDGLSMDEPSLAQRFPAAERGAALSKHIAAADFQIVDCRLPPQIRRIGDKVYFEPQRPIRTTGRDCGIRGGDALLFDPSNYATALGLWLPLAEKGDPRAQTYVGEIYERGLAGSPDYEAAAKWYQRAADQGHASAQVSLGQLYERGLGVSQDREKAMNLYRQASGFDEPLEIVSAEEIEELREQDNERDREERELQKLRAQVERLTQGLRAAEAEQRSLEAELQELLKQLQDTRSDVEKNAHIKQIQQQLNELERRREEISNREDELDQRQAVLDDEEQELARKRAELEDRAERIDPSSIDIGDYHALVIGNEEYANSGNLKSAVFDAEAIAGILDKQYRYNGNVWLLKNATRDQILNALYVYEEELTENDNLLIYYAGHGELDADNDRGYWLPVDAGYSYRTNWVSTVEVTDIVNSMKAKHVLIIADSCYAGALTDAPPALVQLPSVVKELLPYAEWVRLMAKQPARLAMTSGNLEPVPDGTGGRHSIFAGALLETLGTNNGILPTTRLFIKVAAKVSEAAERLGKKQSPTYSLIKAQKYRGGDFFFVPVDSRT